MIQIKNEYKISYAVRCEKGLVRNKNQDNYWCLGNYLDAVNVGLDEILIGNVTNTSKPVLAVFDGMGGEKCGEIAAYIAADTLNSVYSSFMNGNLNLNEICSKINQKILSYSVSHNVGNMGTTAVMLCFDDEKITALNIGDSKIFKLCNGRLSQITCDHVMNIGITKRRVLLQYLGIAKEDFIIEPYFAEEDYNDNDRYLICSDGLTDILDIDEIESLLNQYNVVSECADALTDTALLKGAADNITIILSEIHAIN